MLPPHTERVIDGEVLACIRETADNKVDVTFVRLPSTLRGVQRKQWDVRGLPKSCSELKMHPGLDMLIVSEILYLGRWVTTFSASVCRVA